MDPLQSLHRFLSKHLGQDSGEGLNSCWSKSKVFDTTRGDHNGGRMAPLPNSSVIRPSGAIRSSG